MDRTPEPALMDTVAQASAYAAADFSLPHQYFADEFVARFGPLHPDAMVIDLGCGPADITVRLARLLPGTRFVGVDGAEAMLAEGRRRVDREGLGGQIDLRRLLLPDPRLADSQYDAVVSNSLLHHLADPTVLWTTTVGAAAPGAPVMVMDLRRPDTPDELERLVRRYAADEDPVLVDDFRASLHAAYTPDEVRAQLAESALAHLAVEVVSDRHLVVAGRAPHPTR